MKKPETVILLLLIMIFCSGGMVPAVRSETEWADGLCHVMVFRVFTPVYDTWTRREPEIIETKEYIAIIRRTWQHTTSVKFYKSRKALMQDW
ncbi:MAG: hypothetical protein JW874_01960 [Spirochaetales bacterium]|nr:hypothetical protein [Spirochaetales bacterium]